MFDLITLAVMQPLNPIGQIGSIVVGLLVMIGSLWGYKCHDVDGLVATWFAFGGLILCLFGIGGVELINAIRH